MVRSRRTPSRSTVLFVFNVVVVVVFFMMLVIVTILSILFTIILSSILSSLFTTTPILYGRARPQQLLEALISTPQGHLLASSH